MGWGQRWGSAAHIFCSETADQLTSAISAQSPQRLQRAEQVGGASERQVVRGGCRRAGMGVAPSHGERAVAQRLPHQMDWRAAVEGM